MGISASKLRSNIYKLLDHVLETGEPLEIIRKGKKLKIIAVPLPDKFKRLSPHKNYIACDPEDIVHLSWSKGWKP